MAGAFTIAIGAGPRTVPDIVFHVVTIAVLVWGSRHRVVDTMTMTLCLDAI
jgi:membrane protein involved in colicin uptake